MLQSLRLEGKDKMKKKKLVRKKPALFVTKTRLPALYIQYPNGKIEYMGCWSYEWNEWNSYGIDHESLDKYNHFEKVSDL